MSRLKKQLNSKKGRGKNPTKKGTSSKKKKKADLDWRFDKPHPSYKLSNGQFEQQRDGKTWYWCSQKTGAPELRGCNMWTVHKPHECKGLSTTKKPGGYKSSAKKKAKTLEAKAAKFADSDEASAGYSE